MIGGEELYKLQVRRGLPYVLQKHYDWHKRKSIVRRWAAKFDQYTVYSILGQYLRPLVQYKGTLLDIVTGTQFDMSGKCVDSMQIALYPIEYTRKTAKIHGKA